MISVNAPRDLGTAYRLGSVVYVPHYRRPNVFVGPGYHEESGQLKSLPNSNKVTYSASELIEAGAVPEQRFLWPRTQFTA